MTHAARTVTMPRSTPPATAALMAAVLCAAAGCTICPDPFDYSGPVPNGSAPQNDFRVRSHGILPLGGVPRPWPPVVQGAPAVADVPQVAATAAEVPAGPATQTEDAGAVEATAAEHPVAADPEAAAADPVPVDAPALEEILPPPAPPPAEPADPRGETPGWRPRG